MMLIMEVLVFDPFSPLNALCDLPKRIHDPQNRKEQNISVLMEVHTVNVIGIWKERIKEIKTSEQHLMQLEKCLL
ncbi:hypothetical protein E5288_WYG008025 [Bos mutus]|uniref:Uncharacterized protein n=1 Tax=Bos mutus TaxID=72004 RepID=A0A6B0RTC0_9CETA|nr:hypothetical protein [Bos mutus]